MTALLTALLCVILGACGSRVSGHVYHNNGGAVQVEFKSGGRAFLSNGPAIYNCRYAESNNAVSLVCNGDRTVFRVQEDGALVGPAEGQMARLTPVLNY
jgi:hypothetical protein